MLWRSCLELPWKTCSMKPGNFLMRTYIIRILPHLIISLVRFVLLGPRFCWISTVIKRLLQLGKSRLTLGWRLIPGNAWGISILLWRRKGHQSLFFSSSLLNRKNCHERTMRGSRALESLAESATALLNHDQQWLYPLLMSQVEITR